MATKVLQSLNGESLGSIADIQGMNAIEELLTSFLDNQAISDCVEVNCEATALV